MTLEDQLRAHAVTDPETLKEAPVSEILAPYTLKPIGAGLQSRIFRLQDSPWVLKEGRWDLEFPVSSGISIPLYAQGVADLLAPSGFTFLPTDDHLARQVAEYRHLERFLGWNAEDPALAAEQRAVRAGLLASLPEVEAFYGMELAASLGPVLDSPLRETGFLPREYLLLGRSISPQNQGKRTSFIFQEFIPGTPLHDVALPTLGEGHRRQLVLFLYLLLLLRARTGRVPDTRPRYPLAQAHDWFAKTDNIFMTENGFKLIDTGWLWSADDAMIRRGLIIPEMTITAAANTLSGLLKGLA
ncbi:MAG: hypothetical protein KBC95_00540 [Candidatus Peribacteraceae bacterium]|nr:hypothetical protein [Candidatus Peribacteraceae bacterium]